MAALTIEQVEREITAEIKEAGRRYKIETPINRDLCPGNVGIESPVLVSIMGRLAAKLEVSIPLTSYIFHDKRTHRQLSIKEAAAKLLKVVKDGK